MPPYEVTRIVRSAGFDPLAPPLREGATYVFRATDFRGILMRVVVDAHSGAIRAANRIVAGPGPYGTVGIVMPPPYGVPPVYSPPGGGAPELAPDAVPPTLRPAPPVASLPPLPRPRPAESATRNAAAHARPAETPSVKPDARPSAAAAPAPAPVAAKKPSLLPPIND